jgi:nucleoside-diphosphate-sugar epimerase
MFSVVGGSGFIGTTLCRLMESRGLPFEIIDLKPSGSFPDRCKIADIRDLDAVRDAVAGDTIINLAAVHRDDVRDRSLYYSTNVDGTQNLCTVATEKGIDRIVFTSTVAVYGFAEPDTGEDGALNPFNDYGRSKLQAEERLRDWYGEGTDGRVLAIVRPTVVFGEGNRGNVYNLLNQIARGRFVMVGNGKNRKSMAYVENVAEYLLYAATKASGQSLVNYVDKPDFTMNQLIETAREVLEGQRRIGPRLPYGLGLGLGYVADLVTRVTGKSLPISSIRVRKFCANTCFASAAHDAPGFAAPVPLAEGLARTLQAEFIDPDPDREMFFTE